MPACRRGFTLDPRRRAPDRSLPLSPRKLIRDSVLFASVNYVVRAALMLRGVVAASLLGPAAYGAWNALMLVLDYGALSPLGTQQGLDQLVPQRHGAGDAAGTRRAMRAAVFNLLVASALFAMLVMGWLARNRGGQILTHWHFGGVALALAIVLLVNLSNYKLSVSRSLGEMGAVTTWFLLQGAFGTALGLSLIPWFGAWGLLWGWAAGTLVAFAWITVRSWHWVEIRPVPSRDVVELLRVGFPMYLYLASTLVMRTLDRIVILRFVGTEALGMYSLAVMAMTFVLYLPDSVSYVLYPHFVRRFNEAGRDVGAIRDRIERVLSGLAVVMPALCGVGFIVAREVAFAVLPQFVEGATAARILCFGAGPLAIANLSSIVLMTLGRQLWLAPLALVGVALGLTLDVQVLQRGYGITGVAWATLATFLVTSMLLTWFAATALGEPARERVRFVARLFVPWAVGLLLAESIDTLLPYTRLVGSAPAVVARLTLGVLVFAAVYGLAFRPMLRRLGLPQLLREFGLERVLAWRRREEDA
jgi:O-antigen/teichoic acid export membrane protein